MGDLFGELLLGIFGMFNLLLELFRNLSVFLGIDSVHLELITHHLKLTLFHFLALLNPFYF